MAIRYWRNISGRRRRLSLARHCQGSSLITASVVTSLMPRDVAVDPECTAVGSDACLRRQRVTRVYLGSSIAPKTLVMCLWVG